MLQAIKNWSRGRPGNEATDCGLFVTDLAFGEDPINISYQQCANYARTLCKVLEDGTISTIKVFNPHKHPKSCHHPSILYMPDA